MTIFTDRFMDYLNETKLWGGGGTPPCKLVKKSLLEIQVGIINHSNSLLRCKNALLLLSRWSTLPESAA